MKELEHLLTNPINKDVLLKDLTTYKTAGKVPFVVRPKDTNELINVLKYLKDKDIAYKILGRGSNVIFNESGYNGIIIKLDEFNNLEIFGRNLTVGAGYSLMRLAYQAALCNLTGLEFAAGIPGTIGGAIYMNAGAYKSDMGYIVLSAKVLTPDYHIITLSNKDLAFHYRDSFFHNHKDYICLEVNIELQYGVKDAILAVMADRKKRRLESQPLEYPSAGSVFRNPKDDSAGRIIESLGLKAMRIGDAMVSTKHANFIINMGNATGEDIKKLILEIRTIVEKETGIVLTIEQEFVE